MSRSMIGTRLGRYELQREIGRGGMAVVYLARDPALDRLVAVKVLHPHLASRPDSRERFGREARAAARLSHPNIVEVYDYSDAESEEAFIVTEYIEGPTMRAFVEASPINRPEVAALIMVPIFEALAHAHEKGIIHRDIKPENIMFRPSGMPVLMDFGIAQVIDMETLTATGTILGSPAHMAPEIVEGEPAGPMTDVFSAGTVLYWLVCGALPFSGPTPGALFRRILECEFDPVLRRRPHTGTDLARLIERSLARDPPERASTTSDVADALRVILDDAGMSDLPAEIEAFTADPPVYQENLARRLVPAYMSAACEAWEAGFTARALDFLDRVLSLDDRHTDARALLVRIERGRRARLGAALTAATLLVGLIGVGAASWLTEPEPLRAPTLDAQAPIVTVPEGPVEPDALLMSRAPDGAPRLAIADAARRPKPIDAAAVAIRPPRRRRDAAAPQPATATITIRGYPLPARVKLDGSKPLGTLEDLRGQVIQVPAGRHHLDVEHPYCLRRNKPFVADPTKPQPISVTWRCQKLAGYVLVKYPKNVLVRVPKGGHIKAEIFGETNTPVAIPLPPSPMVFDARVTLHVATEPPTVRFVRVVAGQTSEVTL